MNTITDILSYGDLASCATPDRVIIHACKEPCHRKAVGYTQRSLASDHASYLTHETDDNLYLNIIDPPLPLFKIDSFVRALEFAKRHEGRPLHIHCNQGLSRAPSVALLIMAKNLRLLPDESYEAARAAFTHPYEPGAGIVRFLTDNWRALDGAP